MFQGTSTLLTNRGPSFTRICLAQSTVFLYLCASRPCIRVFTTSSGVLPNTEQAPAKPPNRPTIHLGTGFLGSPWRYQSLQDSITKNLMAWLLPCFNMVAVRPGRKIRVRIFFASKKVSCFTLINSPETLFFDDVGHPVGESSIARLGRPLVIDKFNLDRFHRGHGKNGFADASPKTGQHPDCNS